MRILLTNDDSVSASGLLPLIRWCQTLGEVTVAVPKFEQSGKSHGIELHEPYEAVEVELEPGLKVWTVDSTPADCVRFAVLGLRKEFDLCISGINRGFNIGTDLIYSGTVGAPPLTILMRISIWIGSLIMSWATSCWRYGRCTISTSRPSLMRSASPVRVAPTTPTTMCASATICTRRRANACMRTTGIPRWIPTP